MRRFTWLSVCALVVGLVAIAPVSAAHTAKPKAVKVVAGKPSEFRFTVSPKLAKRGVVTFKVTNGGTIEHDFEIDGKVTKKLAPGKTATLRVKLHKGKFTYFCTLPGHKAAGMKGTFRVS